VWALSSEKIFPDTRLEISCSVAQGIPLGALIRP
jgi:hypothetical protein